MCFDITQKHLNEAALRESEAKMHIALDASRLAMWVYDIAASRFTVCGSGALRLGFDDTCSSCENMLAQHMIMPDSAQEYRRLHTEVDGGAPQATAVIHFNPQKVKAEWQKITYTTVFGVDGKPLNAVGVAEDISALRQAENRFTEEAKFREAMQKKVVASCKLDLTNDKLLDVKSDSAFYQSYTQCKTATQLCSTMENTVVGEEQREKYRRTFSREALLRAFAAGTYTVELQMPRHLEKEKVWLHTTAHLMKMPGSEDVICFLYSLDVTEENMRSLLMDALIKTDYEFILAVDVASNSARRYCLGNAQECSYSEKFFDYEKETTASAQRFVVPEDRERFLYESKLSTIRKKLAQQGSYTVIYGRKMADGTVRQKQMRFSYMLQKQEIILLARTDVTQALAQEKERNRILQGALQAAEENNRAKSEFLARMSH